MLCSNDNKAILTKLWLLSLPSHEISKLYMIQGQIHQSCNQQPLAQVSFAAGVKSSLKNPLYGFSPAD